MSKALSSYNSVEVKKVVDRRIKSETKGLGYWAAVDYAAKKTKEEVEKNQK